MRALFENIDSYIYFIQIETGPIKIGRAKDPFKAIRELKAEFPYDLRLLYFFPGGVKSANIEKWGLRENRIKGSWFWPTEKVLKEIEEQKEYDKKNNWSVGVYNPDIDFRDERLSSKYWDDKC